MIEPARCRRQTMWPSACARKVLPTPSCITCLPICSAAQERDQDRDQSSFVGDVITVSDFPHDTPLSCSRPCWPALRQSITIDRLPRTSSWHGGTGFGKDNWIPMPPGEEVAPRHRSGATGLYGRFVGK